MRDMSEMYALKFFKNFSHITLCCIYAFSYRLLLSVLLGAAVAQTPPKVDISMKSTGSTSLKNPNAHIFETKPAQEV